MIDKKKIKEIEVDQKRYKKWLLEIETEIKFAKRDKTKKALLWQQDEIKRKIRNCETMVDWEMRRHNYTDNKDFLIAQKVSGYIGKEIKSVFVSDKNTPQILLGVVYKDAEPNYSSAHWVAIVRYWYQGRMETRETFINAISLADSIFNT